MARTREMKAGAVLGLRPGRHEIRLPAPLAEDPNREIVYLLPHGWQYRVTWGGPPVDLSRKEIRADIAQAHADFFDYLGGESAASSDAPGNDAAPAAEE